MSGEEVVVWHERWGYAAMAAGGTGGRQRRCCGGKGRALRHVAASWPTLLACVRRGTTRGAVCPGGLAARPRRHP
jgi:hypothetical protein